MRYKEHVSIPEEIGPVSSIRKNEIIADLPALPHISEIGALDEISNLWYFHLEDVTEPEAYIIAISKKISMEYIINGDIKELATIGIADGKDTISAPPTEIIWDESFIGGGGGVFHYFPSILTGP
ncbi:unnamed protein product [Rhizophagus irregularis]|uniref:Uncharacterized protein n=1 Tax=Rhizophagus irregularis TaxID=588596 RepID=A0A916A061_9GLOM|nr:unnamed protein product [Rhizophagus irregularis]